MREEV
jgi:hypothetical protein